jgi:hypothetical protein
MIFQTLNIEVLMFSLIIFALADLTVGPGRHHIRLTLCTIVSAALFIWRPYDFPIPETYNLIDSATAKWHIPSYASWSAVMIAWSIYSPSELRGRLGIICAIFCVLGFSTLVDLQAQQIFLLSRDTLSVSAIEPVLKVMAAEDLFAILNSELTSSELHYVRSPGQAHPVLALAQITDNGQVKISLGFGRNRIIDAIAWVLFISSIAALYLRDHTPRTVNE